jgi:hypothetical protein
MFSQSIKAIAGTRQGDVVEGRHVAFDKAPQSQSGLLMIQGSCSRLPAEHQPTTTLVTTGWTEAIQHQGSSFRGTTGQQGTCIAHREIKACGNWVDGQQTIAKLLLSSLCSRRHGIKTSLFHAGDRSLQQQLLKACITPWLGQCCGGHCT